MESLKKVWEFIKNFVIIAYILLIIFVTICLLSFNEYKVTEFGKSTLIPIIDEDLEPDYTVGDLVIVSKGSLARVEEGDVIFFYRTTYGVTTINYAKVIKAERVTDTEFTYTVEGDYRFSSSYYIGNAENATVIPNVGKVLSVLESKWGFLFLGVFPSLVAFIYTLNYVVIEVRETKEAEKKKKKKKKKKSTSTKSDKVENVKKDETIKEMVEEIVEEQKKTEEPKVEIETEPVKVEIEENKAVVVQVEKEEPVTEVKIEVEEKNETEVKVEEKKEEVVSVVPEKVEIKAEVKTEVTEVKIETKEEPKQEPKQEQTEEQKKKAAIEAKMKSMTEEEKRALIEAKLKSMTPEEKKALIEAKKKKLEAEKNKKGE